MTFVLPNAVPRSCTGSNSTAVPPSMTPGLNVRCASPAICSRNALRMRASFVDGAVADVVAKDLRRVRRRAGDAHLPARRPAPRGDGELRIAGTVLESDRESAPLRPRPRAPRAPALSGSPGVLLVAGHDDDDVHRRRAAPVACSALSAETMTTSPPFMSMMPGPRAVLLVEALELLERAVLLEHRVEMTDQQDARSRCRGCSATRCPARLNAAPSTQRVVNPSAVELRA